MTAAYFIRDLREKANLTQVEVSKASGICQPNLSHIESGHRIPTEKTIAALRKAIAQVVSAKVETMKADMETLQVIQSELESGMVNL